MKYISLLVLVTVILLPSAVCAQDSPADGQYARARALLEAVAPGLSLQTEEEAPLTRAEFTRAMVSLLGVSLPAPAETGFSDVPADHPAATQIYYAAQIGAVSPGVLFFPEQEVTYQQAVKMLAVATGYAPRAEANGGYPGGYLAAARDAGLTEGVSGGPVTARCAVFLLRNMLTADLMRQTGYGPAVSYEVRRGENILSEYHQLYRVKGVVAANQHTGLYAAEKHAANGRIFIGVQEFYSDAAQDLLGCRVNAYYRETGEEKHIAYITPEKNGEVTISAGELAGTGADFVIRQSKAAGREEKFNLYAGVCIIKNGKAVETEQVAECLAPKTGSLRLVDNDRDGLYDVVFVESLEYGVAASVDGYGREIRLKSAVRPDGKTAGDILDLSAEDCFYRIYDVFEGEKEAVQLSDIPSDALLCYAASEDEKYYQIYLCNDYAEGKVTAIDYGEGLLWIDGEPCRASDYFLKNYPGLSAGLSGGFQLGLDGSVVVFAASDSGMRYGWLVKLGRDGGVAGQAQAKLFVQDGKMAVLSLADRITVDGEGRSREEAYQTLGGLMNGADAFRMVRFGTNGEGYLNRLDLAAEVTAAGEYIKNEPDKNSLRLFFNHRDCQYKSAGKQFAPCFNIAGGGYNFVIPSGADREKDEKYRIVSPGYFELDKVYKVSAYDVGPEGSAGAVLVSGGADAQSVNADSASAIVEKITRAVNDEDQEVYKIYLWRDGVFDIYYSDPETTGEFFSSVGPGDILRIAADSGHVITAVQRDYALRGDAIDSSVSAYGRQTEYFKGAAYSVSGGYMNVLLPGGTGRQEEIKLLDIRNASLGGRVAFVEVTEKTREDGTKELQRVKISNGTGADIIDYISAGNGADKVVIRERYLEPNLVVVYRTKNV